MRYKPTEPQHTCDGQGKYGQRVQAEGCHDVAVQKLVQGPQSTTAGAKQSRRTVEQTNRVKAKTHRVEAV